jgi:hypothetical protein
MTLAEAEDILGSWDELPPPALSLARIEAMLAAWLGVRRRGPQAARMPGDPAAMPADAAALMSELAKCGVAMRDEPDDAIFEFAALKAAAGQPQQHDLD